MVQNVNASLYLNQKEDDCKKKETKKKKKDRTIIRNLYHEQNYAYNICS